MAQLDYDLSACLIYNPQDGITEETITSVLAVWEGENDGDDWRWVVELTDGRRAYIQGGCDYTGWDCVSNADSWFIEATEDIARLAVEYAGYRGNGEEVAASLLRQIAEGKNETWREAKDREFGVVSGVH